MGARPTILDVARHAEVSKSTVSLVLRDSPSVRPETRARVRRAMADIGYIYNRSAASLRSARSGLIGLVVNDLQNPFFTEFATTFQMALADHGYATVIANTAECPDLQARTLASLFEYGISGIAISPAYGNEDATLAALASTTTPALQVLRRFETGGGDLPFLAPDYSSGGALGTRHLLERGCRRIAFLGGPDDRPVTRERMSGYLSELRAAGLAPIVRTGQSSREFGRGAMDWLRETHPNADGVLCFNDLVALGVLASCARAGSRTGRGSRAGGDIKVVGTDDIAAAGDSFPSLTTVSCHTRVLAHRAADLFRDWIGKNRAPPAVTRLPMSLVQREST